MYHSKCKLSFETMAVKFHTEVDELPRVNGIVYAHSFSMCLLLYLKTISTVSVKRRKKGFEKDLI